MTEQDAVWLIGLTIVFIFYCIAHNQYEKFEAKIKKDLEGILKKDGDGE